MKTENDFLLNWLNEWTFKKRRNEIFCHNIHKYPAMFIPEVVEKLINTYSNKGDTVLDIFSGSGTSILEAMLLGRNPIGIELNPLACLISKVKCTPIKNVNFEKEISKLENNFFKKKHHNIYFEKIEFWFSDIVIESLSRIIGSINSLENKDFRDLALISLSDIIRYVSLCKHSGFKMHKDTKKQNIKYSDSEIFKLFKDNLNKNIKDIIKLNEFTNKITTINPKIINADSRNFLSEIGESSIDLIVTSPPYGDSRTTVAYGEFSRLSSQFLGLESFSGKSISGLDKELLGGLKVNKEIEEELSKYSLTLKGIIDLFNLRFYKNKDEKTIKRLNDIVSFYNDLLKCLKNSYLYLKDGKYLCMVTASRIVHDTKLHTDIIISEMGNVIGFKLKNIHYRDIPNKRMPNKVSAKNIVGVVSPTMTVESIIIMQKI